MSLTRTDMLRELELLPMWWRRKEAASDTDERTCAPEHDDRTVAQAPTPATSKLDKLIQGEHGRGYLPHLKAEGGIYFVTFRLADSLPAVTLTQWDSLPEKEKNKEIENWLDAGHGECLLGDPDIADLVQQALLHRQEAEYRLHSWTIMPNHVHLVIEPTGEQSLSDVLQGIKSASVHAINQRLGRHGVLWQRESYDHLIRNDEDFARCCEYVRQNPVKAGLSQSPEAYPYCDRYEDAGEGACATATTPLPVAQAPSPANEEQNADPAVDRRERIHRMDWAELKAAVAACEACSLARTRTQTVFGVGDENADWLFVGEAPGAEEDKRGEPFVGQAGQLLDNMLAAIRLKRGDNVYIANVLKCRPPQNRDPHGEEVVKCDPFLKRQVELIRPKLIVALGKFAAQSLLGGEQSIAALRGKLHDYHGVPLIVTYHPAYLLRNMTDKAKAWEDLCFARSTMRSLQSSNATISNDNN